MIDVPWSVRLLRLGLVVFGVALIFGLGALIGLGPFRPGTEAQATGFTAQADQICRAGSREFERLQQDGPKTPAGAAALAAALARVAASEQLGLNSLSGLAPDPDALTAYLEARAEAVALIEAGAGAARDGNMDAYQEAQLKLATGQAERRELAVAAGLGACSA